MLSFDRCQFRLTEESAAAILQSVIGGVTSAFRLRSLADRVFRLSVFTPGVGFHIYKLRSLECSQYKLFFHLWHNGGPNFASEFCRWEAEEAAAWTTVARRASSPATKPVLTGANSIPIEDRCVNFSNPVNGHGPQSRRQSVFTRLNHTAKSMEGANGPGPQSHRQTAFARPDYKAKFLAGTISLARLLLFNENASKPSILGKPPNVPAQDQSKEQR